MTQTTQRGTGAMAKNQTTVYDPENPPSITIIKTIAEQEGVDSTELDLRLYDYLNPDALDNVMESNEVEVTVSIVEYDIQVVDSDIICILE
ncbi:HalOD1 output domain-containing protein [Halosolutus amylolyticus]|uniref:HalOD1 output domain-containing protein n=1 Tax=Halosolutus amylolyticus TaxID=2932267 RepID=A0ABD5PJH1_9EURY|nr:HalOD1 output domain-containing protein [Halosolutus amylolyticus]